MPEETPVPDKPVADPLAELRAQLDAVKVSQGKEKDDLKDKLNQVTGQLQVLSAAASESLNPPPPPADAPDLLTETEKALDFHFQKRTQPLIAQQLQREAAREKELTAVKRADDWKKFGAQVEQLVAQNRLPNETLSTPGAYDQLLDIVKAKNIDAIVKEKVEAEVANWRASQAKEAGISAPGAAASPGDKSKGPDEQLSDDEARIARKLGVDPKKYAEQRTKTVFDGVHTRGEVIH